MSKTNDIFKAVRNTQAIPPGMYWTVSQISDYPSLHTSGDDRMRARATTENAEQEEVFAVIQVSEEIPYDEWPWQTWGPAAQGISSDPYSEGVWTEPGPSWEHYLATSSEKVEEIAQRTVTALGKSGSGLLLGVGGAALAVGLAIYLARKN